MKRTFQPSRIKRARTHGFRARMATRGGRKVIKGKVTADTAEKYRAALENVGLVIKLEPADTAPPQTDAAAQWSRSVQDRLK